MIARAALVVVPMLVALVIAIGLRIGAGEGARAAVVYGAPAAKDARELRWQVETFRDYLAAREIEPMKAHATITRGEQRLEVAFASNEDGAAEIALPILEPSWLEIRADDDGSVLASGSVRVPEIHREQGQVEWLKPTRASGALAIHVAPWGGKLVSGFSNPVTVRVEGAPASEIELEAEGEESATIDAKPARLCASGVTTLSITPLLQAAGLTVRARAKSGASGEWFGALPVAPGALHVSSSDLATSAILTAPGNAKRAYVELDDDVGRAWAAIVALAPDDTDARPHARLALPPLRGDYWLVYSPDPRGAETLGGATVARRVHMDESALDACVAADRLAASARPFPRQVVLDGLLGRRAMLAERRSHGRVVALSGLASGGLLELLLILRAARAAKRGMQSIQAYEKKPGALEVAILIFTAMFGFAVLAAVVGFFGQ